MVALGRIPARVQPAFFKIEPAVPGAFRWSGTTILIFTPDAKRPLALATTYKVTIAAGAAAVSGRKLARPFTLTFTTPTVRLLRTELVPARGQVRRHDHRRAAVQSAGQAARRAGPPDRALQRAPVDTRRSRSAARRGSDRRRPGNRRSIVSMRRSRRRGPSPARDGPRGVRPGVRLGQETVSSCSGPRRGRSRDGRCRRKAGSTSRSTRKLLRRQAQRRPASCRTTRSKWSRRSSSNSSTASACNPDYGESVEHAGPGQD